VCQWQFSRVLISVLVAVRRQTKKPATVDRRLFGGFSPLSLFTALASPFPIFHISLLIRKGSRGLLLCKWNALKENQLTKANTGRGQTQWHPPVKR